MTSPSSQNPLQICSFLEHFFAQLQKLHHQDTTALTIEYDSQWPSQCYVYDNTPDDGDLCRWKSVKQDQQDMFDRLSDALDTQIHPDIIEYYTSYWSNHLPAATADGDLELIQVWNQQDMERLRANLLGQALDKRKRKLALSFFFAITTSEDGMLCLDNSSGEVWYEIPGKKPVRKIADSLNEFLQTLSPR